MDHGRTGRGSLALHGGIARENKCHALAVGGVADHVHVLVSLPATIAFAKAVQLFKGGSSKWVHDTFPEHRHFEWQEGYGAFTIGMSQKETTIRYIQNQNEHHRQKTFQEHGVEFDPRFVWG